MSAFAWPVCLCLVVLILGLVVLFQHRVPIAKLIDRTRHIGKSGVTTSDETAIATQTDPKNLTNPSPAAEILKAFDNQLLVEQEGLITGWLDKSNVSNPAERERILTRYLASTTLSSRFEGIYYGIFGSQLKALEMLNQSVPDGLPIIAMEAWYEFGKTANASLYGPNGEYTFEQWLSYMRRMTLLATQDLNVHITLFGSEFLRYLVQNSYSLDKRG
jgi:hypothetical protein